MPLIQIQEKLIGCYIPTEIAEAFSLITTSLDTDKSHVIRQMVTDYVKSHSEMTAIRTIAQEYAKFGDKIFTNNNSVDILHAFLAEVRISLKKKKILTGYIEQVCSEIESIHKGTYVTNKKSLASRRGNPDFSRTTREETKEENTHTPKHRLSGRRKRI
jgi:hypothetical protein